MGRSLTRRDVASTVSRYRNNTPLSTSTSLLHLLFIPILAPILALPAFADTPTVSLTAKHYVSGGLVFHLDGKENGGYGTHVDAPTELVDLAQSKILTLGESESGSDNAFFLASAHSFTDVFSEAPVPLTLEAFLKPAALDGSYEMPFLQAANRASLCFDKRTTGGLTVIYKSSTATTSARRDWSYVSHPYATKDTLSSAEKPAYRYTGLFNTAAPTVYVNEKSQTVGNSFWNASCAYDNYISVGCSSAPATYHSVRVYNRHLTSDERKWNANVDMVRFEGTNVTTLAWPTTMRLDSDGNLQSAFCATCPEGKGTVSLNGGAAATSTNVWLGAGASLSLTVTPATGYAFDAWTGDVPPGCSATSPTLNFTFDSPRTVTATFHGVHYVSTAGEDAEGRGTPAAPYRTIQYAASKAAANDWIYVAGGQYDEAVSLGVYRNVSGSWNSDFTAQDLKDGRTVIRAPSTSQTCLTIAYATGTNVIDALTLSGGKYGIYSGASGGSNDSSAWHHILTRLIVSNNVNGICCNAGFNGVYATACLFADNSGYGYYHTADHGTCSLFRNCTFVRNGQAFYRQGNYLAQFSSQNCVFLDNSYVAYASGKMSVAYERCLFYGNTVREWWSGGTQSNWPFVFHQIGEICADPKLGTDFAPGAGSAAIARGKAYATVTTDVYGTAFDGSDMGCVKATAAAPTRYADTYAAPTGDDANSGADADHPKRTVNAAVAFLADGGTCHVADGTYVEDVMLGVNNMTLVGASVAHTVIQSATGTDGKTKSFAVGVLAPNVVVSNLTCNGSGAGVFVSCALDAVTKPKIVRSVLSANCNGFRQGIDGNGMRKDCWSTLSHVQIRNSLSHGLYADSPFRIDNVLIADSGECGLFSCAWNNLGNAYLNNVTVTGCGTYGYYFYRSYGMPAYCYNSIFENCATMGVYDNKSGFHAYKCCFYGNGNDNANTGVTDEKVGGVTSCIYVDPLLDTTASQRGHLGEESPCSQTGGDYSAISQVPSLTDLDYAKRLTAKMDIGCYDSPETINDLVGDGYHVVRVEGDPDGYGEPEPGYGRHITPDGSVTLDVGCSLSTDAWDGQRHYLLSEGVRARYVGYELIRSDDLEVLKASDTDESCTFTLETNVTFRIKWVVEDLLTLSGGAAGCVVSVNGGAASEAPHVWVTNGAPVTVTVTPSDNYAHSAWTGDVPSSVDPKESTITWTSDQPRTITATLRNVHYVCLTGSDDNDGTKQHPWRTINHAIADASTVAYDEIKVQGGTYEESVTNSSAKGGVAHLVLSGSWNANWERDLRNARTVVTPPAAWQRKAPCLYMDTALNTILGFTFTGGSEGIRANPNASGTNDSTTDHHELAYLIVTNNVNGIDFSKSFAGVALVASLVADNAGYGYYHFANLYADRGARDYIYNCTFARNGAEGIRRGTRVTYATVKNCVFDRNGVGVRFYTGGYALSVVRSCFGNSVTSAFMSAKISIATDNTAPNNSFPAVFWTGNVFASPLLDATDAPTANSPFLGRGQNLVQDSVYGFATDVYGRLWDGVWDYGCFKSSFSAANPVDEQYVSETGTDANDGLTAATAKRSIAAAVAAVGEGGTVHVAAGHYEPFCFTRKNVRVLGAGRGITFVEMPAAVTAATAVVPGVSLFANGVTVEGVAIRNCFLGAFNAGNDYTQNPVFRDCTICENYYGVFAFMGTARTGQHMYFERCRVTDNGNAGFWIKEPAFISSSLIARNGGYGIYANPWNTFDTTHVANCTVLDNKGYGITGSNGDWSSGIKVNNSIVAGHKVGIYKTNEHWGSGICVYNTVLHNDTNCQNIYDGTKAEAYRGGIYVSSSSPNLEADPRLRTGEQSYGRPRTSSPALGYGKTRSDFTLRPTLDLDGRPYNYTRPNRLDCGCYARPPTPLAIMVK